MSSDRGVRTEIRSEMMWWMNKTNLNICYQRPSVAHGHVAFLGLVSVASHSFVHSNDHLHLCAQLAANPTGTHSATQSATLRQMVLSLVAAGPISSGS